MSEWRPEDDPETQERRADPGQPPWRPGDPWAESQAYWRDYPQKTQSDGQYRQQANPQQEPYPLPQPYGQHARPPAGRLGKGKLAALVAGGVILLLLIISVAAQGGKGAPSSGSSPTAGIAAPQVSATSKSPTSPAADKTTAAATSTAPAPPGPSEAAPPTSAKAAAPSSQPPSSKVAQTASAAATPPTPTATASCQPLNSTGQCFQAGDSCPAADHNQSGVDGTGKAITCRNNHGWHWESS